MADKSQKNRYFQIMEHVFKGRYHAGDATVEFTRDDIAQAARELNIKPPKNLGDVVYSLRYRSMMPQAICDRAPSGKCWIIRPAGFGKYRFVAVEQAFIEPNRQLVETHVPDATPGIIEMYALSDEQALLAKVRYNRLIDVFTGITCYSLQNHLRTAIEDIGQVETDEVYVGIDKRGAQYVIPVQAKGARDRLNIVQIEQDFAVGQAKFPDLICLPIAAQFLDDNLITLFSFEHQDDVARVLAEKHYRLTPPEDFPHHELARYRLRADG